MTDLEQSQRTYNAIRAIATETAAVILNSNKEFSLVVSYVIAAINTGVATFSERAIYQPKDENADLVALIKPLLDTIKRPEPTEEEIAKYELDDKWHTIRVFSERILIGLIDVNNLKESYEQVDLNTLIDRAFQAAEYLYYKAENVV